MCVSLCTTVFIYTCVMVTYLKEKYSKEKKSICVFSPFFLDVVALSRFKPEPTFQSADINSCMFSVLQASRSIFFIAGFTKELHCILNREEKMGDSFIYNTSKDIHRLMVFFKKRIVRLFRARYFHACNQKAFYFFILQHKPLNKPLSTTYISA